MDDAAAAAAEAEAEAEAEAATVEEEALGFFWEGASATTFSLVEASPLVAAGEAAGGFCWRSFSAAAESFEGADEAAVGSGALALAAIGAALFVFGCAAAAAADPPPPPVALGASPADAAPFLRAWSACV